MADIWVLSEELKGNTNYKYVLDIIDHFSKFTQAYLLNTKEGLEVFSKIRNFCDLYGNPNILITDNGLEFKNKYIKNIVLIIILNFCMVYHIGRIVREW